MKTDFERVVMDQGLDAHTAVTLDGRVAYWSKGAESMFGFPSSEAMGNLINDLIVPPERHEEHQRVWHEVIAKGAATFESIRRRKDGSLVYVDISCNAVRDAEGSIEHILYSKKDVTHLKVLRDAKLVESRFGSLLESTPDGIV